MNRDSTYQQLRNETVFARDKAQADNDETIDWHQLFDQCMAANDEAADSQQSGEVKLAEAASR